MHAPATPALLRELNERTVLEAIRDGHPISRAEVARRAGLSKPTVSLALQSLLDAGLVRDVGLQSGRRGRGAVLFEPVAEAGHVLGIDIGARFVRGAVADLSGQIRAREDVELVRGDAALAFDAVERLAARLASAAGIGGYAAAVSGSPGVIDPATGRIWLADLVVGLNGLDVAAELARRVGMPVTVENDVNLAALGEQSVGAGRGVADFAFLSIGSGMGAGLVLGGELHRGRRGAAGEVDFVPLRAVQPPGAVPIDPSAEGVSALARSLHPHAEGGPPSPPEIFAAARDGDALARSIVAEEVRWIAYYVAAIMAVVDVELIVLGGGIGANHDLLANPVREVLASLVPYPPDVAVSALGVDAVLSGALAVGVRAALDLVFVNRIVRERSIS